MSSVYLLENGRARSRPHIVLLFSPQRRLRTFDTSCLVTKETEVGTVGWQPHFCLYLQPTGCQRPCLFCVLRWSEWDPASDCPQPVGLCSSHLTPLTMQLNPWGEGLSRCTLIPGSSYLSATSRGKLTLWFSSIRASCCAVKGPWAWKALTTGLPWKVSAIWEHTDE